MDKDIESRVDLLEQHLELYKKLIDNHNGSIGELERRMDNHFRLIEINDKMWEEKYRRLRIIVESDHQKLYEIYYKIFPDRIKQDFRVMRQLDALEAKPSPDAKPTDT